MSALNTNFIIGFYLHILIVNNIHMIFVTQIPSLYGMLKKDI